MAISVVHSGVNKPSVFIVTDNFGSTLSSLTKTFSTNEEDDLSPAMMKSPVRDITWPVPQYVVIKLFVFGIVLVLWPILRILWIYFAAKIHYEMIHVP